MNDIKTLKLLSRDLKRKSGNILKGNPNPKIHPNYNIKYAPKPGPTSHWGKLKSSRNAQKYKGKALRLSKDSLYIKEYEEWLEREFESFLNFLETYGIKEESEEEVKELIRNLKRETEQN